MGKKYKVLNNLNLISKLNYWRLKNLLGIVLSFYWTRLTKKTTPQGYPISLSIEPTTSCNLQCPECPSGLRSFSRDTGQLTYKMFSDIIDQVKRETFYLTLYFQGEPYLNKDIFNFIAKANKENIYTTTSTNAHFLNYNNALKTVDSGLDCMIISLDGTDQETYQAYRKGGKLEKVIEGTKNIIAARKNKKAKKPYIIFQFLVVAHNEHQVEDVKHLAKKLGVDDVKFKTAQIYDYENGSPLIPSKPEFSRYKKNHDGTWSIKNPLYNHCWKMWHSCVITWDGKVLPCCFDKDADHQLGDINKESFKNIWNNEAYKKFRSALLTSRKEIDICKNCSEGTKVWA